MRTEKIDKDAILQALGINREWGEVIWPALGAFAFGCLVGAGLGMIFAPKPGAELRQQMATRWREKMAQAREKMPGVSAAAPSTEGM